MEKSCDRIAGLVGMVILSAFLIGLADSIHAYPFWVIVVMVLAMGWVAYYEEAVRGRPLGAKDGAGTPGPRSAEPERGGHGP